MFLGEVYIDKERLKKRFKRSIETYNEHAIIQQNTATELMEKLSGMMKNGAGEVLEIGCGTGLTTTMIMRLLKPAYLFVNDIVADFEQVIQQIAIENNYQNFCFIPGDIQNIAIPANLDLIVSTSTFQWIDKPSLFIKKISGALNTDGILAFSTFGDKNLNEIKSIENKSLNYTAFETLQNELNEHFNIIYSDSKIEQIYFNTAIDVLKHLKKTGVNCLRDKIWTKKRLNNFLQHYEQKFNTSKGLSLTYNPVCFILTKKNE